LDDFRNIPEDSGIVKEHLVTTGTVGWLFEAFGNFWSILENSGILKGLLYVTFDRKVAFFIDQMMELPNSNASEFSSVSSSCSTSFLSLVTVF